MFERKIIGEILRLNAISPSRLQIVIGPRQVGKTTAARQAAERSGLPSHYASADAPLPPGPEWIEAQWTAALHLAARSTSPVWLILDEIQKVRGWSEEIKRLWDADPSSKLRPLLLGSSALLLQKGLTESLAGRFFLHRCTHWNWPEMREAFGWNLDTWLLHGGYPGAAPYIGDPDLWLRYINDSDPASKTREGLLKRKTRKWKKHKAGMRGDTTASSRKTPWRSLRAARKSKRWPGILVSHIGRLNSGASWRKPEKGKRRWGRWMGRVPRSGKFGACGRRMIICVGRGTF